jgi:hypothetical protein
LFLLCLAYLPNGVRPLLAISTRRDLIHLIPQASSLFSLFSRQLTAGRLRTILNLASGENAISTNINQSRHRNLQEKIAATGRGIETEINKMLRRRSGKELR